MSVSSQAPSLPAAESLDSTILRLLMETIPDLIYFKDEKSRFVRVNQAWADLLGVASPELVVGKTDFDFFSPALAQTALAAELEIMRSGQPLLGQTERLTKRDGTVLWGSTTKLPWHDADGKIVGTFGLTRNITARHQAEEELIDERNLLRTIIDHLPSRIFVKDIDSRYLINNRAHLASLGLERQEDARGHTTLDFHPGERGEQAIADDRQVLSGGPAILGQEKSDFGPQGDVHWSLTTKVPFRDRHGVIAGLVGVSHDITRRKRAEEELQRRTDEMEADVRMARQIQEAFLPVAYPEFPRGVPPEASALKFAHRYIPATTLGGDFFDIVRLADTKCGVLVCDVMGHGVRAGLLTAMIRGVLGELGDRAENPVHVMAEINRCLSPIFAQTGQPVFATAFYGVIDTAAGEITYTNAGHPPPLVMRPDSFDLARLAPANPEPAAGLLPGFAYTHHQHEFQPGDRFFGYTDGLLEAADAEGNFFGDERICALLLASRGFSGTEINSLIVHEIESYTGRTTFEDDVCLLTIESTGTTCTLQPLSYEI